MNFELTPTLPQLTAASPLLGPSMVQRLWNNRALSIGCFILLGIIGLALFAPLLSPFDPYAQDLTNRTVPPFWYAKGS
jgi:peptide/nickel transport system permease protein